MTVLTSAFFSDQFSTPELRELFSDHSLLQGWLDAEVALARSQAALQLIPTDAAEAIARAARADRLDWPTIKLGIDQTFHPIVPMVRELSRLASQELEGAGRYVHWGTTTQDIMDTGAVLQLRAALAAIEPDVAAIENAMVNLATTHADTPMAGRTHGQHALPITFGFKVAVWLAEWRRHRQRLAEMRPRVLVGQLAGAAGTLAGFGPRAREVHEGFCRELGLGVPPIAWHTARDGFAELGFVLGLFSATLGKIAREVIALQKTEVGEVEEPWDQGKVGSSTMPHKRNPMICELIVALARLGRQDAATALDGMIGEHERDMGSWQSEWEWLPRAFQLTGAALRHSRHVLENLIVYPDRMRANLDLTGGAILSEAVMLRLGEKLGRNEAHDVVHHVAMAGGRFAEQLAADPRVAQHLTPADLAALLDPATYAGLAATYAREVAKQHPPGTPPPSP